MTKYTILTGATGLLGSFLLRDLMIEDVPVVALVRSSKLETATDVSELPEAVHPLIVSYVVGRERMGGDVSTQGGGNIYISMYNAAKAKLRGSAQAGDPYTITNRY